MDQINAAFVAGGIQGKRKFLVYSNLGHSKYFNDLKEQNEDATINLQNTRYLNGTLGEATLLLNANYVVTTDENNFTEDVKKVIEESWSRAGVGESRAFVPFSPHPDDKPKIRSFLSGQDMRNVFDKIKNLCDQEAQVPRKYKGFSGQPPKFKGKVGN